MNDIEFASLLNFVSAAGILLIGIATFVFQSSGLLQLRFMKHAFGFWLGQWFSFTLVWMIEAWGHFHNKTVDLVFSDVQSMLALGLCWSLFRGEEYQWQKPVGFLSLGTLVVVLYDTFFALVIVPLSNGDPTFLRYWIAPSEVLSAVAFCLLAAVFLLRYGKVALPFSIASLLYAVVQRPAYEAVFVAPEGSQSIRLALAAGKAFVGCTFYAVIFHEAGHYKPIKIEHPSTPNFDFVGFIVRAVGTLLILSLCGTIAAWTFGPPDAWHLLWSAAAWLFGVLTVDAVLSVAIQRIKAKRTPNGVPGQQL